MEGRKESKEKRGEKVRKKEEQGIARQAAFGKSKAARTTSTKTYKKGNKKEENGQNERKREKERTSIKSDGDSQSEVYSERKGDYRIERVGREGWSEKGDIPSADGSSISPACYSQSDGMFINRLISEIGVRLRTIAGSDSSIAIKHKSIISIWPLRACRTFRLHRSRSFPLFIPYTCRYTYTVKGRREDHTVYVR